MEDTQLKTIEGLVQTANARHDEWALEPEAAADYVRLDCGLMLWKPTLPHVWAIARASQLLKDDPYGLNLVVAWLLGHDQKTVRNELMPKMRKGKEGAGEEIAALAEEFLLDAGATPVEVLPVVASLTQEAFGAKKKTETPA